MKMKMIAKKMILNNLKILIIFTLILVISISLIFGFLIGYILTDKSCQENPFSYGLKKINSINNVNLTCFCFSTKGEVNPLLFNEKGFIE